jgi:hypothetical protein
MLDQLLIVDPCIAQHKGESEQVCHEIRGGITRSIDKQCSKK